MLKSFAPFFLAVPVLAFTGENSPLTPGNENLPSQEAANFGTHQDSYPVINVKYRFPASGSFLKTPMSEFWAGVNHAARPVKQNLRGNAKHACANFNLPGSNASMMQRMSEYCETSFLSNPEHRAAGKEVGAQIASGNGEILNDATSFMKSFPGSQGNGHEQEAQTGDFSDLVASASRQIHEDTSSEAGAYSASNQAAATAAYDGLTEKIAAAAKNFDRASKNQVGASFLANAQLKVNPQNTVYASETTLNAIRSDASDFVRSEIDNFMTSLNSHASFVKADANLIRNAQYLSEGLRMAPMKVNVIERENTGQSGDYSALSDKAQQMRSNFVRELARMRANA